MAEAIVARGTGMAKQLIQDSKILLVDTATSAPDWASEKVAQKTIDQATMGITTCVIAHRSSTILKADPILVIVAGELRLKGIHIELMATKGIYYHLQNGSL